jgi:hypothetical protein
MRRQLDTLADRGCWISDDRVYAFVSSAGGICEIGYHGRQPVSRNSRILVDEEGAIRLSIRTPDGVERGVRFKDVEWGPSNVRMDVLFDAGPAGLDLRASGRRITIGCTGSHAVAFLLVIHVSKRSRFTDVHGERKWESRIRDGRLEFRCSDRIMLQSWLNRSGPYAGDFLIPEPIRRMIFAVRKRSGLATREDLTEEFRSADLPLYDAAVFLRIGGSGYSIFETEDGWRFEGEITEREFGDCRGGSAGSHCYGIPPMDRVHLLGSGDCRFVQDQGFRYPAGNSGEVLLDLGVGRSCQRRGGAQVGRPRTCPDDGRVRRYTSRLRWDHSRAVDTFSPAPGHSVPGFCRVSSCFAGIRAVAGDPGRSSRNSSLVC